ncbi:MAG: glycosyltransferase family 4 protein [Planctomycetota bacterium]|jgi:glycosyltransferase involved in cell wall biosynthesis
MRILLLNQVFYPDVAATAQHSHDLAKHLADRGHDVAVIASRSIYGQAGATLPRREMIDGIAVYRVGRSLFGKAGIPARMLDFGLFYLAAMMKAMTIKRPDVVVCLTTPPFVALVGWLVRLLRGSRFVYWVMDLYPDAAVVCGVMKPRSLVTRFFESINRFCLRRADRTVVLGRCMLKRVLDKGVDPAGVVHIGVWAGQDEVKPIPRLTNPYRRNWNLGDRFVLMYAGNFGLGHDVVTMCQAAERLADDDRFRFVFVGSGKKKGVVAQFVRQCRLEKCVVAPYEPREKLALLLSCGDVHLATLSEGAEGVMVPCKLFGAMAAGRPTIFVGHPDSELARVLAENDCGINVRQGDVDGMVDAIRALADDTQRRRQMGQNARAALRRAYDRQQACEAWRRLLEDLGGPQHNRPAERRDPSAPRRTRHRPIEAATRDAGC